MSDKLKTPPRSVPRDVSPISTDRKITDVLSPLGFVRRALRVPITSSPGLTPGKTEQAMSLMTPEDVYMNAENLMYDIDFTAIVKNCAGVWFDVQENGPDGPGRQFKKMFYVQVEPDTTKFSKKEILNRISMTMPPTYTCKTFKDAPSGVYTWVMFVQPHPSGGRAGYAREKITLIASAVQSTFEHGSTHVSLLLREKIRANVKVLGAGEAIIDGPQSVRINLFSGSVAMNIVNTVAGKLSHPGDSLRRQVDLREAALFHMRNHAEDAFRNCGFTSVRFLERMEEPKIASTQTPVRRAEVQLYADLGFIVNLYEESEHCQYASQYAASQRNLLRVRQEIANSLEKKSEAEKKGWDTTFYDEELKKFRRDEAKYRSRREAYAKVMIPPFHTLTANDRLVVLFKLPSNRVKSMELIPNMKQGELFKTLHMYEPRMFVKELQFTNPKTGITETIPNIKTNFDLELGTPLILAMKKAGVVRVIPK